MLIREASSSRSEQTARMMTRVQTLPIIHMMMKMDLPARILQDIFGYLLFSEFLLFLSLSFFGFPSLVSFGQKPLSLQNWDRAFVLNIHLGEGDFSNLILSWYFVQTLDSLLKIYFRGLYKFF